ncbi:unnamed protein product [Caenorhabditis angaria]|uniref:CAF1B/HIR1 beta-propeller domain-containing protein n=1 Tax=Caenorhabditis angaria TaxID=860376 RepID=B6VBV0_9PELO|nr:hypothetical protein Csp3_JD03.002 [Caenorhabditis angaria]CAI5438678.1 unnamed protein product [Caenorhabditis angaria]
MEHYMPQIFWHDRKALLSVDLHKTVKNNKYKIVTSSVQKEVRIWQFEFENTEKLPVAPLAVTFLANLSGHNSAINQVKFSPNSEQNLLASGDCDGRITIWQMNDSPPPPPKDELPPNKENWIRFKILNHDSDVSALCWNPDGTQIASVSNDDCLYVHNALTAKRMFVLRNFRHFPNGICWDPLGKYIITMSADRKMDIVDAIKGQRIKHFSSAELPLKQLQIQNSLEDKKLFKLFHDDQLFSFQRGVVFSPNGELVVAPSAHLELGSSDLFGLYVFKREDLAKDSPSAFYPTTKPTFLIKFSPVVFNLLDSATNFLGLPYRLVWAALTQDTVYFYDSQHQHPIGIVDNIHYNSLTDAAWSSDGIVLAVSSLEGYCSFIKFKIDVWGTKIIDPVPVCVSPSLIEEKKKKRKSLATVSVVEEEKEIAPVAVVAKSPFRKEAPPAKAVTPLTKYFKIDKNEPGKGSPKETTVVENQEEPVAREKKRIQLVTLND